MSLFKDGLMRKSDKSRLKSLLLTHAKTMSDNSTKIIDGGALLHKVQWPANSTYSGVLRHYVTSVRNIYGTCLVVFDGYEVSSIKDQEHLRRYTNVKCPDINFTNDIKVVSTRKDFLSNTKNKTLFISRLSEMMTIDGQEVLISKADADTDIVKPQSW